MGAQRARPPGGSGPRALHGTRLRRDDGRRDRRVRGSHRADVLSPLRRQARSAVRWTGRPAGHSSSTTIVDAPDSASPIEAVGAALEAVGPFFEGRHHLARERQAVIAANPRLQERELIKLATIASAMADALGRRGIRESAARLTAEAGVAVFRVAFERWISEGKQDQLPQFIRESFDELKAMAAGG